MKYRKINTSEREISVSSICVFITVQVRFGLLCLATVFSLGTELTQPPVAHSVTVLLLPLTLHRHTPHPPEKPSADKRDPEERFGQSHSVQSVLSKCSRQPQSVRGSSSEEQWALRDGTQCALPGMLSLPSPSCCSPAELQELCWKLWPHFQCHSCLSAVPWEGGTQLKPGN